MIKKSTVTLILAGIFIFCIIGICRWPYTERLYVMLQPNLNSSEKVESINKSDKLLKIGDGDMTDLEYIREGIFPINYTPAYVPLIVISVGAGSSFTALLCMYLDFYISNKRKELPYE